MLHSLSRNTTTPLDLLHSILNEWMLRPSQMNMNELIHHRSSIGDSLGNPLVALSVACDLEIKHRVRECNENSSNSLAFIPSDMIYYLEFEIECSQTPVKIMLKFMEQESTDIVQKEVLLIFSELFSTIGNANDTRIYFKVYRNGIRFRETWTWNRSVKCTLGNNTLVQAHIMWSCNKTAKARNVRRCSVYSRIFRSDALPW